MAIAVPGFPAQVVNLIQDNVLEREFHDALFPRLLYRAEASPELWNANLGDRHIFTRAGTIPVKTKALVPGNDPTPSTYATEQWVAEASQHSDTVDTNMPTSYVTLASLFLRDTQSLGLNAGQTMNRLARDPMFVAYLEGQTNATAAAAIGLSIVSVASISGFTEVLVNGRLQPVSALNPVTVNFSTAGEPTNTVVAAVPANPDQPFGPGTLQLGAVIVAGIVARDTVQSLGRSRILRAGGATNIDGLSTASVLTLDLIIAGVSRLRAMNVPTHPDGKYHVHLTPTAEQQIFADNHFQRLHQSLPDSAAYRELMVADILGCYFYRNNESPTADTVDATISTGTGALVAPEIGGEVANESGLAVDRTLITGGGVLYERYLDENKFMTDAGATGKIGNFTIVNGNVQVMTERIRYVLRAPLDRLQQKVSQTWSWSGDFPVPSDALSGDQARFKRAVILEHAGA